MQHWVFHPHQEAKIVSTAEYDVLLRQGWFDSPAKFNQKPVVNEPVKVEENAPVEIETKEPEEVKEPEEPKADTGKRKPGRPPRPASNDGVSE